MSPNRPLSQFQRRLLETIFERAAEGASQALSVWLGRRVHMDVSAIDEVDLAEAAELLGPSESLVAACAMSLSGRLAGEVLLVFEDAAGLELTDSILRQPPGTARAWGELEQSAACETANIVGCALLNSLAAHLTSDEPEGPGEPLVPSPPEFRHEFAGSLLEFSLMNQAMVSDRVMLARTRFTTDGQTRNWSLLYVPGAPALQALASALDESGA